MRIFEEGIVGLMMVEAKAGFSHSCLGDRNSGGIEDVLDAGLSLRLAASAKSVKVFIKVILGFFNIEDSTKDEFTSI